MLLGKILPAKVSRVKSSDRVGCRSADAALLSLDWRRFGTAGEWVYRSLQKMLLLFEQKDGWTRVMNAACVLMKVNSDAGDFKVRQWTSVFFTKRSPPPSS